MPEFMAFQLGMALKEFLMLTQIDELPDDFRNPDRNAAYYFKSPSRQIVNLSLLIQELTRSDASKRLTITQFKNLLNFRNLSSEQFYQAVEKVLPSSTIGLKEEDVIDFTKLLDGNLKSEDLIKQANLVFSKLSNNTPKETRLTRLAEKLAVKCYKEYSEPFFKASIEKAIFNNDWDEAPWYRQVMHWLSFGYFSVEKVTDISEVKDTVIEDLQSEKFQSYFPHLEFLPPSQLNSEEDVFFKDFLYTHLEEILSKDADKRGKPIAKTNTLAATAPLDATIPIDATISINKPTIVVKDIIPTDKTDASVDKTDAPINSGTIVYDPTGKDDKDSAALSRVSFFNVAPTPDEDEDEDATLRTKPPLTRVDTIRTTLFRRDGSSSSRKGEPVPRLNVRNINFNSPTEDELKKIWSESELGTPPQQPSI